MLSVRWQRVNEFHWLMDCRVNCYDRAGESRTRLPGNDALSVVVPAERLRGPGPIAANVSTIRGYGSPLSRGRQQFHAGVSFGAPDGEGVNGNSERSSARR
jgi:hypothetical protein